MVCRSFYLLHRCFHLNNSSTKSEYRNQFPQFPLDITIYTSTLLMTRYFDVVARKYEATLASEATGIFEATTLLLWFYHIPFLLVMSWIQLFSTLYCTEMPTLCRTVSHTFHLEVNFFQWGMIAPKHTNLLSILKVFLKWQCFSMLVPRIDLRPVLQMTTIMRPASCSS